MVRLPAGIIFFIFQRGHAGSVTHSTAYSCNTEQSFLMINGPCNAVHHSPPLSAENNKYFSKNSTTYIFIISELINMVAYRHKIFVLVFD